MTATPTDPLSTQIHLLGDLLGETIVEQEGPALLALVEQVRSARQDRPGRARRRAPPGATSSRLAQGLSLPDARGVIKAFTTYFQLVNLAEEEERVRVLHERAFAARRPRAAHRRERRAPPSASSPPTA